MLPNKATLTLLYKQFPSPLDSRGVNPRGGVTYSAVLYHVPYNYYGESWWNHLLAKFNLWHPNWSKIISQVFFCFNFCHLLNKLIPVIPATVDFSEHHFQWYSLQKLITWINYLRLPDCWPELTNQWELYWLRLVGTAIWTVSSQIDKVPHWVAHPPSAKVIKNDIIIYICMTAN